MTDMILFAIVWGLNAIGLGVWLYVMIRR